MPVHDWTRVYAGLFHHFHQRWVQALCDRLNTGDLPPGYYALSEQYVLRAGADPYVEKANRITIRHSSGKVVSVIEIVSPGNKASRAHLRAFVEKAVDFLRQGIHLLVIDLFPPTVRDPQGIHKVIWDEIHEEPFELTPDKSLTLASYSAGLERVAYVEPVAVGDVLPEMPLFLEPEKYVPAPLESTYQTAWAVYPAPLKEALLAPPPRAEGTS